MTGTQRNEIKRIVVMEWNEWLVGTCGKNLLASHVPLVEMRGTAVLD